MRTIDHWRVRHRLVILAIAFVLGSAGVYLFSPMLPFKPMRERGAHEAPSLPIPIR